MATPAESQRILELGMTVRGQMQRLADAVRANPTGPEVDAWLAMDALYELRICGALLKDQIRSNVVLARKAGVSWQHIAQLLGVPAATARARFLRLVPEELR